MRTHRDLQNLATEMPKMGLFRDILRDTFFQSKKKIV